MLSGSDVPTSLMSLLTSFQTLFHPTQVPHNSAHQADTGHR
jgi:hypothetical protein